MCSEKISAGARAESVPPRGHDRLGEEGGERNHMEFVRYDFIRLKVHDAYFRHISVDLNQSEQVPKSALISRCATAKRKPQALPA